MFFPLSGFGFGHSGGAIQFTEVREEEIRTYALHISEVAHEADMFGAGHGESGFPSCDRGLGDLQNPTQDLLGQAYPKPKFTNLLWFKWHL